MGAGQTVRYNPAMRNGLAWAGMMLACVVVAAGVAFAVTEWRDEDSTTASAPRQAPAPTQSVCARLLDNLADAQTEYAARVIQFEMQSNNC